MIENSSKFRLSENAWLALLPVMATYLAFLFQGSYFYYFGVPFSLVDVDVNKIILSMAALAFAAILFVMLFSAVTEYLRSQNPVVQILGKGLAGVVILLPIILSSTHVFTVKQLLFWGAFFLCIWLSNFWLPPQKKGEHKSYMAGLKEQEEKYAKEINAEPRNFRQAVGKNILVPFYFVFFLSLYVIMLGTYCASVFGGQTYLKDKPDALYVGKTGGVYIFTIVDLKTNTFGNNILLKDSDSSIELVRSERKASRK